MMIPLVAVPLLCRTRCTKADPLEFEGFIRNMNLLGPMAMPTLRSVGWPCPLQCPSMCLNATNALLLARRFHSGKRMAWVCLYWHVLLQGPSLGRALGPRCRSSVLLFDVGSDESADSVAKDCGGAFGSGSGV